MDALILAGDALARFLEGPEAACGFFHLASPTYVTTDAAGVRWYVTRCDHCGATLDVHDEAQERERVLETLLRPPARPQTWFVSPALFRQLQDQQRLLRRFDVTLPDSPHAQLRGIDIINVRSGSPTGVTVTVETVTE